MPRRLAPLELATTRNSRARDSRRNLRPCLPSLAASLTLTASVRVCAFGPEGNWPSFFMLFSHASRHSFHLSFKVLVRYRTLDMFRLGRSALPYSVGDSGPTYSLFGCLRVFAYGAVALFGCLFQGNSAIRVETLPTHISVPFRGGFRSAWADFTRRYYRHRVCFLFLRLP